MSSRTDTWLTPPAILEALGPFDLDPCAAIGQPWPTAAHHFTIRENGLLRRWAGRVFLNPPYSKSRPWMARMAEHGVGTALVFARTETSMFFDFVWGCATLMLFIRDRVHFRSVEPRKRSDHAREPSVLIAYGENDADRLAESGLDGALVLVSNARQVVVALPAKSWREIITDMFRRHGAELPLQRLYALVADHPRTETNPNWQAKVRQQVRRAGFVRVGPGVYRLEGAAA